MRQLYSNMRWNVAAFGCTLISNIVTVPLAVRWIGISEFGKAGLVMAICAPMMLVGTVLGQALVSPKSARLGAGDCDAARRITDASVRLCFCASLAAWVALEYAGPWVGTTITGGTLTVEILRPAFLICAGSMFLRQQVLIFQSICVARQSFATLARISALAAVFDMTSTACLAAAYPNAEGYLASIATGIFLTCATWIYVLRTDLHWRSIALATRSDEIRQLLTFSKWQGATQFFGTAANQIDRYLLGALAPVAFVGQYNVAGRLAEAAYTASAKGSEVLFPHFGRISSHARTEQARHYLTGCWLVATMGVSIMAPLLPLSGSLLWLWVGPEVGAESGFLLRTLVLCGILGITTNVFMQYAMGIGRNKPAAWVSIGYSIATVVFSVILLSSYGPRAAGAGMLVASVLRIFAVLHVSKKYYFPHLPHAELMQPLVLPVSIAIAASATARFAGIGETDNWVRLLVDYALITASVSALIVCASFFTRSGGEMALRTIAALRLGLEVK